MIPIWIALITAFLIDVLLGDPPNRFHPVVAMGNLIHTMTARLNRGSSLRRFMAGTGVILFGGALFSLPWLLLLYPISRVPQWAAGILLGILLKPVFAFHGLIKAGRQVQRALQNGDLEEARRQVAWSLVSRDTRQLSAGQVTSAAIESLAENITDSFFAPLFFFTLGGLPLAWFYRFVNTADAMIAYHTPEYEYFGKFTARLDDVLNWIPARIAGVLVVIAAAFTKGSPHNAWRVMTRQNQRTSSPNAGWTMAAAAGALGIVLEKTGHYRLEGGPDLPHAGDISRAIHLVTIAMSFCLILCGALAWGWTSLF